MTEPQQSLHFLDYWRVIQSRKEIVIAVFLLVVVTGILVTYTLPRKYRASCKIAVEEEESRAVEVFNRNAGGYDPFFLRTQFEIIQSRPVIEETIRKLNLNDRLAKAYGYDGQPPEKIQEQTYKIVAGSMRVQPYRDTNLIEIRIDMAEPKESAPQDAARLANTIAMVYRDQNLERFREEKELALAALADALDEQERRVDALETKVETIRQDEQIDIIAPYAGSSSTLDKMSLARMEELRIRALLELEDKKAVYNKIQTADQKDLLNVAPRLVGDEALQSLVAAKRSAEVERSRLTRVLGDKHPDVVAVDAAIADLDSKITDQLRALKLGVEASYEAAQAKVASISDQMDVLRATERTADATGWRKFRKAQEELNHARRVRDALEMRYIEERIELRIPRTTVDVVELAKAPDAREFVSPNLMLFIALSVFLGLASGVGLAYFIEYLDTSLKTVEDIERFMEMPVVGVIPQKVRPFVDPAADTRHAEPYRVLRANIQFSSVMTGKKTLCVTSGSVGEGKSLTIFNLAYICAQLGDRTIIIDSDLHRPRQHRMLGVSNQTGLANVLVGEITVNDAVQHTQQPNLDFLPSGKLASGVHGLLDSNRMKDLIAELSARYDLLLFDAPPMIGVSDASLLVREVDGVLLVIQHRKYPRAVSKRAKGMIENVGGNVVGVVLNNINVSRDYSYYYHHAYYSYAQPETRAARTA